MKIEKLEMSQSKFDINLKFYFFLKYLVKTKLTDSQATSILKIILLNAKNEYPELITKILQYTAEKIKKGSSKQKLILKQLMKLQVKLI
jgi:hypothetical protein